MIHKFVKTNGKLSTIIVAFDAGSRSESNSLDGITYNSGIAHMLEHCIFKGTKTRSANDINREVAYLGGYINAFTSHEKVQYYITVPSENIEKCMEILSDIIFNSTFPEEEFQKEREVVKEEEISRNDNPMQYIYSEFSKNFFSNYLGKEIIGTQDTISKFTRDEVAQFHKTHCGRERAVVSLCSNISRSYAKTLMSKYFGISSGKIDTKVKYEDTKFFDSKTLEITKSGIEHSYSFIGFPVRKKLINKRPEISVMDVILTSGMDSRLFTEVREKRGLVYGIGGFQFLSETGGVFGINFSTRDKNIVEANSVVKDELERIKSSFVTEEELQRAKNKLKAEIYSAAESSNSMASMAVKEVLDNLPSLKEYSDRIHRTTLEDIKSISNDIFDFDKTLNVICRKE